ncbi:holin [Saccharopolyspora sp. NPDC003752]
MLSLNLARSLAERALNAALVVFVGALSGNALNLFHLDWPQVGSAVLGAAVLEVARGLLAATGLVGDKGSPALLKESQQK